MPCPRLPRAFLDPALAELQPFPGIPDLLGVFTAATRRAAVGMLAAAGIDSRFEVVVAEDEVARPKPAPDGLLLAARRLGSSVRATVYVGDAEVDLGCVRAAGALGVHARWGARPGVRAGSHRVAASPGDLIALLGRLVEGGADPAGPSR